MFGKKKYWYFYCKWLTLNSSYTHGHWYIVKLDKPTASTSIDGKSGQIIESSKGPSVRGGKFNIAVAQMYDVKFYQTADELMADKFNEVLGESAQPPKQP